MTDVDVASQTIERQMQSMEQEKTIRQQNAWIAALEEDNLRLSAQLRAAKAREASVCKMYQGELLSKGSIMGELANAKGMVTEIWNWAIRSGPALSQRQTLKLLKAIELVLSGKGGVVEEFTRDMLICQALGHVIAAKQLMGEADGNPPDDEDTEPIAPIPTEPDETPPVVVAVPASEESAEKVEGEESPVIVEAMGNKQLLVLGKEGPAVGQQQAALSKAEGGEERQKPAFLKAPPRIKVPRWPANTASAEEQAVYSRQFGQAGRIVSGQVPADFREGQTTVIERQEDAAEAEFNRIITDSNRRIAVALSGERPQ